MKHIKEIIKDRVRCPVCGKEAKTSKELNLIKRRGYCCYDPYGFEDTESGESGESGEWNDVKLQDWENRQREIGEGLGL